MSTYFDIDMGPDTEATVETFTGRELYNAFSEDYDGVTDRAAQIFDKNGTLLASGRLMGLRFEPVGQLAADGSQETRVLYSFGSLNPDIPWDRSHRIELTRR
ncbi:hypothetical protein P0W64_03040 [Tsukamurella sp. 8F]|uniref:hypothetical protein n=1 Tax=unclassified Tsukamurella TaxID=2633480 RepID=UPI0023B9CB31|nr:MULTISPECIES: hypothetical protein [unclassified Tsukamurella]MDF0529567.1 hypothetical protein [Tsukamurella sp. 8J]MDF0585745.1 hypothetical protein [Tsukamurella sp. 8F]